MMPNLQNNMGSEKKRSTTAALLVLENMIAKSIEWKTPMWIISIDFKKAFDRINHTELFDALLYQGVEPCYVELLKILYTNQNGILGDLHFGLGQTFSCAGVVSSPLVHMISQPTNCASEFM